MRYKKMCPVCKKRIRKEHKCLRCSVCSIYCHQKCAQITPSQLGNVYNNVKETTYDCEKCVLSGTAENITPSSSFDFQDYQDKILAANQNDLVIGPAETANLYLGLLYMI